jgi:hypothetical protein
MRNVRPNRPHQPGTVALLWVGPLAVTFKRQLVVSHSWKPKQAK